MRITKDIIKSTIINKGYEWFENSPNLIGIRSTVDVPNVFNDFFCLISKSEMYVWTITTDPGTYWLEHPLNKLGTAVLKPNQWRGCYSLGYHQGKREHPALVQTKSVTVYRDNNKDNRTNTNAKEETGLFGINIHRSNLNSRTMSIGRWSAGCQVFQSKKDHDVLLSICHQYKKYLNNQFTYSLIDEIDLYST